MSTVSSEIGKDRSKIVYIGNIPFEATDQQLIEIFRTVGRVVAFKTLHDKETGRPKGHAYCEFKDSETAQSAIRNLNGHNFHGRTLRVAALDSALTDKSAGSVGVRSTTIGSQSSTAMTPDQITSIIEELTPQQQVDLLAEYKALAHHHPAAARQLLVDSPQLATALMQMQIMFGFLTTQQVKDWQTSTVAAGVAKPATGMPPAPPAMPSSMPPPPPAPHAPMPARPPAPTPLMAAPTPLMAAPLQAPAPPPPAPGAPVYPPAVQATLNSLAALGDQQRAALREALKLTPQQLDALPGGQQLKAQVLALQRLMQQGIQLPL